MKHLNQFITEYIVKKKLDNPIDSEDHYEYFPKTKEELIENIKELIKQDIYDFNCINTSEITDMSHLFDDIENRNFDVSKWDVSNVENMSHMFYGYSKFEGKGLENWNVGNVTNMSYMFYYCENFDCDLYDWNVSNVTDMKGMFTWCNNFTGKGLENWDVSNVKYMTSMFANCISFEGKGLENWNISNVKDMHYMFNGCTSLINTPTWHKK